MENILKGLVASMGITYEYTFNRTTQFVKNDKNLTGMVTPLFQKLLGASNVHIVDPATVGEDFSAYSHLIPSFYFFLSAGENRAVHTPDFVVDEGIFKIGPLLLTAAAMEYLGKKGK